MKNLATSIVLFIAALALGVAQTKQPPPQGAGQTYVASQYGTWITYTSAPVASGSNSVLVNNPTVPIATGQNIMPFVVGEPIAVNRNGSSGETVNITAASNCFAGSISCTFTADFANAHATQETLQSGTYGLQEAINAAMSAGSGTVLIDATWQGPSGASLITAATGSSTVIIQDNRTTPTTYAWNGSAYAATGGGTSLPTASAAGQTLSSTAAGRTYAVQGALFYAQSSDTLTSIESECSSLCTYIVTVPQTITLSANHTLSANVQISFAADGLWTINGSSYTLTIPGNVAGTLNQHFAGSAAVAFGSTQAEAPVEWFGAVGDDSTDDTVAIQACVSALSAGQCVLQAKTYKITAVLNITKPKVGLRGTKSTYWASELSSTSASADIIDVAGVSTSAPVYGNDFNNFILARTQVPTGTASGLSLKYAGGYTIDSISSNDSIRGFYFNFAPSYGVGIVSNSQAGFTFAGETSGSYYGFYLDSSNGNAENSIRFLNDTVSNNTGSDAATIYGMILTGSAINDVMTYGFETANVSYGQYVSYTGSGNTFATSDIHFTKSIHDNCSISCYYITGTTAATDGSIEINGGWVNSSGSTGYLVNIESSYGVAVTNVLINEHAGTLANTGIRAVSSSNILIANNTFTDAASYQIVLSSTNDSVISGNTISSPSGETVNTDIYLQASSYNAITGNSINGHVTNSVILDGTSNYNAISGNSIDPTNAGPISNSGTGNTVGVTTTCTSAIVVVSGIITGCS